MIVSTPTYQYTTCSSGDCSYLFRIANKLSSEEFKRLSSEEIVFTSSKRFVWLVADFRSSIAAGHPRMSDYTLIESDVPLDDDKVLEEVYQRYLQSNIMEVDEDKVEDLYKHCKENFLDMCLDQGILCQPLFEGDTSNRLNIEKVKGRFLTYHLDPQPCYVRIGKDIEMLTEDWMEDEEDEESLKILECLTKAD